MVYIGTHPARGRVAGRTGGSKAPVVGIILLVAGDTGGRSALISSIYVTGCAGGIEMGSSKGKAGLGVIEVSARPGIRAVALTAIGAKFAMVHITVGVAIHAVARADGEVSIGVATLTSGALVGTG